MTKDLCIFVMDGLRECHWTHTLSTAKTYGAAANGRPTRKTMIIRLINLATRTTSRTRGRQHLDSILLGPDTTYRSELIDASFFEPDPSC